MIPAAPYLALAATLAVATAYTVGYFNGGTRQAEKAESARVASVQQATDAVLLQVQSARAAEKDALDRMAAAEMDTLKEVRRAERLEDDLSRSIAAGSVRLQPSICASRPSLPPASSAAGQPDASADDGARRLGSVVSAAARCDAQVRGLQALVRNYLAVRP